MTEGPAPSAAGGRLPDAVRSALAASFRLAAPDGVLRVDPVARRGRMAESARVLVQEAGGCRRSVFAKWPSRHARIRHVARHSGAYEREVRFYRDLADDCGTAVPEVHHSGYDAETGEFVLLLEDLVDARPGDDLNCSVADVRRALRAVATLHARWADGGLAAVSWLPDCRSRTTLRYTRFELDRIARAAARGRFAHGPARPMLPLLEELALALEEFFERAASDPQTLVHGDLHMDQVLLPNDRDTVIVDWQLVQLGDVGMDVARLITMSLPTEERRRHESDLLETYRTALEECGGPPYRGGELLDAYRRGVVWTAFVNTSYYLSCAGARSSVAKDGFHDVLFGRIAAAAADHGLLRCRP